VVLGDLQLGLTVGVLLELPWLAEVPVGGVRVNEGNVGALVSASLAILLCRASDRLDVVLWVTILWGMIVAVVAGSVVTACRRVNVRLLHRADAAAARGDMGGVSVCHISAIALSGAAGVLMTIVGVEGGMLLLPKLISLLPASWDAAFGLTRAVTLGVGIGAVCMLLLSRKNLWAAAVGLVGGLLWLWWA
jgi:mannose/fructose/N-acetylgalactosamine-specific phosphotransferase system component IIC